MSDHPQASLPRSTYERVLKTLLWLESVPNCVHHRTLDDLFEALSYRIYEPALKELQYHWCEFDTDGPQGFALTGDHQLLVIGCKSDGVIDAEYEVTTREEDPL